ncbi:MAG: hypothetical protein ACLQIQ_05270 [Beijerinckiaceae bacterium]
MNLINSNNIEWDARSGLRNRLNLIAPENRFPLSLIPLQRGGTGDLGLGRGSLRDVTIAAAVASKDRPNL